MPAALDPELARELGHPEKYVRALRELLESGATVPFIARYRKEATGGMDEVAILAFAERHKYLSELEARRASILTELQRQGVLSPALEQAIRAASSKTELEDLYLPFKPKKRSKAELARKAGLEPLADLLWRGAPGPVEKEALRFVSKARGITTVDEALEGAGHIAAERVVEHVEARKIVREEAGRGAFVVKKKKAQAKSQTKFDNYDDFTQAAGRIPSHRFLAILRGEKEGVLKVGLDFAEDRSRERLERLFRATESDPAGRFRKQAIEQGFKSLKQAAQTTVTADVRERAEFEAAKVFADNVEGLLLAPPFGSQTVLGIDPGQRTGCKCAVVDQSGAVLAHGVIQLVGSDKQREDAKRQVAAYVERHGVCAVAVGNGTHGRETLAFVSDVLREKKLDTIRTVSVNEAGASVYSASEVARDELPEFDITIRGAVSIARRLQDPLAELVKVDPKSIGVGQYQHDIPERLLEDKLRQVVESVVNRVGVDVNTASPSLLSYVSGIGPKLSRIIVDERKKKGLFKSRRALLDVPGLGQKTFEQAAGFLRVRGGKEPLDESAVHPERYALVARMAKDSKLAVGKLIGNRTALANVNFDAYTSEEVGTYTLQDIRLELEKPGRDPRSEFQAVSFRDDVRQLSDVQTDMILEGTVTNVTSFGAFVDVGVHQDGLVHISELSQTFIRSPDEVVRVGDTVKVKVLEVDLSRKRLSLSVKQV
jgi:uncharacterized protein